MTINQRLKEFVAVKKITQTALAKEINCSQAAIGGWFTKGEKISVEMIQRILTVFKDLNARWLITAEGDMLEDINHINEVNDKPETYGKDALKMIIVLAKENKAFEIKVSNLEEDNQRLREKCGESDRSKARAG